MARDQAPKKAAAKPKPQAEAPLVGSLSEAQEALDKGAQQLRCEGLPLAEQLQLSGLVMLDKHTTLEDGIQTSHYLFGREE